MEEKVVSLLRTQTQWNSLVQLLQDDVEFEKGNNLLRQLLKKILVDDSGTMEDAAMLFEFENEMLVTDKMGLPLFRLEAEKSIEKLKQIIVLPTETSGSVLLQAINNAFCFSNPETRRSDVLEAAKIDKNIRNSLLKSLQNENFNEETLQNRKSSVNEALTTFNEQLEDAKQNKIMIREDIAQLSSSLLMLLSDNQLGRQDFDLDEILNQFDDLSSISPILETIKDLYTVKANEEKKNATTANKYYLSKQKDLAQQLIRRSEQDIESAKSRVQKAEAKIDNTRALKAEEELKSNNTKLDHLNKEIAGLVAKSIETKEASDEIHNILDNLNNYSIDKIAGAITKECIDPSLVKEFIRLCEELRDDQVAFDKAKEDLDSLKNKRQPLSNEVSRREIFLRNAEVKHSEIQLKYHSSDSSSSKHNPDKDTLKIELDSAMNAINGARTELIGAQLQQTYNNREIIRIKDVIRTLDTARNRKTQKLKVSASGIIALLSKNDRTINHQIASLHKERHDVRTNITNLEVSIKLDATTQINAELVTKNEAVNIENLKDNINMFRAQLSKIIELENSGLSMEVSTSEVAPGKEDDLQSKSLLIQKVEILRKQKKEKMIQLEDVNQRIQVLTSQITNCTADVRKIEQELRILSSTGYENHISSLRESKASQLAANLYCCGYIPFGTWRAETEEENSKLKKFCRLMVADVLNGIRPVELQDFYQKEPNSLSISFETEEETLKRKQVDLTTEKLTKFINLSTNQKSEMSQFMKSVVSEVNNEYRANSGFQRKKIITFQQEEAAMDSQSHIIVYEYESLSGIPGADYIILQSITETFGWSKHPEDEVNSLISEFRTIFGREWSINSLSHLFLKIHLGSTNLSDVTPIGLGNLIQSVQNLENSDIDVLNVIQNLITGSKEIQDDGLIDTEACLIAGNLIKRFLGLHHELELSQQVEVINIMENVLNFEHWLVSNIVKKVISLIKLEMETRKNSILTKSGDSSLLILKEEENLAAIALQKELDTKEKKQQDRLRVFNAHNKNLENQIEQATKEYNSVTKAIKKASESSEPIPDLDNIEKSQRMLADLLANKAALEKQIEVNRSMVEFTTYAANAAKNAVEVLGNQIKETKSVLDSLSKEKSSLYSWILFIKSVKSNLNKLVKQRPEMVKKFLDIRSGDLSLVFDFIIKFFPDLTTEANTWKQKGDDKKSLELKQLLNKHLYEFPKLELFPGEAFRVSGFGLCSSEVMKVLNTWTDKKAENLGFKFNDDKLVVSSDKNTPISKIDSKIQLVIVDRIQRYYQHSQKLNSSPPHWDAFDTQVIEEMREDGYFISRMDFIYAYAPTVEILLDSLLVDESIELPGLNLFITVAGDVIFTDKSLYINTSPRPTLNLKYKQAKGGDDYESEASTGRFGDNGMDAPAGANAGHVTIRAYGEIKIRHALTVKAIGADGCNGQIGGNGGKGKPGIDTVNANPKDTSGFGGTQLSIGITRFPGQDTDRNFTKLNEISGNGGDAGRNGLAGGAGAGGEVTFQDSLKKSITNYPEDESQILPGFNVFVDNSSGNIGDEAPSVGAGGEGGIPGKRGFDLVRSKYSFFHKTDEFKLIYIDTQSKSLEKDIKQNYDSVWNVIFAEHLDSVEAREYLEYSPDFDLNEFEKEDWGWSVLYRGTYLSTVPTTSLNISQQSKGKNGRASVRVLGKEAMVARKQAIVNKNISVTATYEQRKYNYIQAASIDSIAQLNMNHVVTLKSTVKSTKSMRNYMVAQQITLESLKTESQRKLEEQSEVVTNLEKSQKQLEELQRSGGEKTKQDIEFVYELSKVLCMTEEATKLQQDKQNACISASLLSEEFFSVVQVALKIEKGITQQQQEYQSQITEMQISNLSSVGQRNIDTTQLSDINNVLKLISNLNSSDKIIQHQQIQDVQIDSGSPEICQEDPDITFSVSSYFAAQGECWKHITDKNHVCVVRQLLSDLTKLRVELNNQKVIAMESLELMIRYANFNHKVEYLIGLLQIEAQDSFGQLSNDQSSSDQSSFNLQILQGTIEIIFPKIRIDHWFIRSLTGSGALTTNSSEFTLAELSLETRYGGIAKLPYLKSLTQLELSAYTLVMRQKTTGTNLNMVAKFLKDYTRALTFIGDGKRTGVIALYTGKPVLVLEKISAMLLRFVRQDDDELVSKELSRIFVCASLMSNFIEHCPIQSLKEAMKRIRDPVGSLKPNLPNFLDKCKGASVFFEKRDYEGTLRVLRDIENGKKDSVNICKAPGTLEEVQNFLTSADLDTESLSVVAQVIANGIQGTGPDFRSIIIDTLDKIVVISSKMQTKQQIQILHSCVNNLGDTLVSFLLKDYEVDGTSMSLSRRISNPKISVEEKRNRILAFCYFIEHRLAKNPCKKKLSALIDPISIAYADYALYSEANAKSMELVMVAINQEEIHIANTSAIAYETSFENINSFIVNQLPIYQNGDDNKLQGTFDSLVELLFENNDKNPVFTQFWSMILRTIYSRTIHKTNILLQNCKSNSLQKLLTEVRKSFPGQMKASDPVIINFYKYLFKILSSDVLKMLMQSKNENSIESPDKENLFQIIKREVLFAIVSKKDSPMNCLSIALGILSNEEIELSIEELKLVTGMVRVNAEALLAEIRTQLKGKAVCESEMLYNLSNQINKCFYEMSLQIFPKIRYHGIKGLIHSKIIIDLYEEATETILREVEGEFVDFGSAKKIACLRLLDIAKCSSYEDLLAVKYEEENRYDINQNPGAVGDGFDDEQTLFAELLRDKNTTLSIPYELCTLYSSIFLVMTQSREDSNLISHLPEIITVASNLNSRFPELSIQILNRVISILGTKESNTRLETYKVHSEPIERIVNSALTKFQPISTDGEFSRRQRLWKSLLTIIGDLIENSRDNSSKWETYEPIFEAAESTDEFEDQVAACVSELSKNYNLWKAKSSDSMKVNVSMVKASIEKGLDFWGSQETLDLVRTFGSLVIRSDQVPSQYLLEVQKNVGNIVCIYSNLTEKQQDTFAPIFSAALDIMFECSKGFIVRIENDNETKFLSLPSTIQDLSGLNPKNLKFRKSCTDLALALDIVDYSKGRYSCVDNFEQKVAKECLISQSLDAIKITCRDSANIIEIAHNYNTLHAGKFINLFEICREATESFDALKISLDKLKEDFVTPVNQMPSTEPEAMRILINAAHNSKDLNIQQFKKITKCLSSERLIYKDVSKLIDLVMQQSTKRLLGRMYFIRGMLLNSVTNEFRSTDSCQALITESYSLATAAEVPEALNNLLVFQFDRKARDLSVALAIGDFVHVFRDHMKQNLYIKENAAKLKNGVRPTKVYELENFEDQVRDSNQTCSFKLVDNSLHKLISFIKQMRTVLPKLKKPFSINLFTVIEECNSFMENGNITLPSILKTASTTLQRLYETVEKLGKQIGGEPLDSLAVKYSQGNCTEQFQDITALLELHSRPQRTIELLIPREGTCLLDFMLEQDNSSLDKASKVVAIQLLESLMSRACTEREELFSKLPATVVLKSNSALYNRIATIVVNQLRDVLSEKEVSVLPKRFIVLCRFLVYYFTESSIESESLITQYSSIDELNLRIIMSNEERNIADVVSLQESVSELLSFPPTLWLIWLRRYFTREHFVYKIKEELIVNINTLKESYSRTGYSKYSSKLIDEVDKIEKAMSQLFVVNNIDDINSISTQYQAIYNAAHCILHFNTYGHILPDIVDKSEPSYENMKQEQTLMVKQFETACNQILSVFSASSFLHESIISLIQIKGAKENIYSLLNKFSLVEGGVEDYQFLLRLFQLVPFEILVKVIKNVLKTNPSSKVELYISTCKELIVNQFEILLEGSQKTFIHTLLVPSINNVTMQSTIAQNYLKIVVGLCFNNCAATALGSNQPENIVKAVQLSISNQVWNSEKIVDHLTLTNFDAKKWILILKKFELKLQLGYKWNQTSIDDELYFDRIVNNLFRLRSRHGDGVVTAFVKALASLPPIDTKTLYNICAKVVNRRYSFEKDDIQFFKSIEHSCPIEISRRIDEFYNNKSLTDGIRDIKRIVEVFEEHSAPGEINETLDDWIKKPRISDPDDPLCEATEIELRYINIQNIYNSSINETGNKISVWSKGEVTTWAEEMKETIHDAIKTNNLDIIDTFLAVFNRATELTSEGKKLHIPQLLGVLFLLDARVKGKSRIGEICTGEGKSLIIVCLAILRSFCGDTVDIITSNSVLAVRDSDKFLCLFQLFHVEVANNCDELAESNSCEREKRYRLNSVVYGDIASFERDILLSWHYGQNIRNRVGTMLIVDEVDSMLIDTVGGSLYISHGIEDLRLLNDILVRIWVLVHGADVQRLTATNVAIVVHAIESQINSGTLLVPKYLIKFARARLHKWVKSAYQAKMMPNEDQYKLGTGMLNGKVVVVDLPTGVEQLTTQWSNGLHQFLQLKHNNVLTSESLKAVFIANSSYFSLYGSNILGVTGTLGGRAERNFLANTYKTDFFGLPRAAEAKYFEKESIIVHNRYRWLEIVTKEALDESINLDSSKDIEIINTIAKDDIEKNSKKLDTLKNSKSQNANKVEKHKLQIDVVGKLLEDIESISLDLNPGREVTPEDLGRIVELKNSLDTRIAEVATNTDIDQSLPHFNSKELKCKSSENQLEKKSAEEELKKDLVQFNKNFTLHCSKAKDSLKISINHHTEKVNELKQEVENINLQMKYYQEKIAVGQDILNQDCSRAVLIICQNILDAKAVTNSIVSTGKAKKLYKYYGAMESIIKIDPNTGADIGSVVLSELNPGEIIVATNIAGRGTNFETSKILNACGGLHVILSFVPPNVRVEVQAWGRTSRFGSNGSGIFIVHDPRMETIDGRVDVNFLLQERDSREASRLRLMQNTTLPRVETEEFLFRKFSSFAKEDTIRSKFQNLRKSIRRYQESCLRNRWAYFIDEQEELLSTITRKNQKQVKTELKEKMNIFIAKVRRDCELLYGLISEPGVMIKVVRNALLAEDFSLVINGCNYIIDADPKFGAYAFYYKALGLFGSGTSNIETKKEAISCLEQAILLFNREICTIQAQVQSVNVINSQLNKSGIGSSADFFTTSFAREISLIQSHLAAAKRAVGYSLHSSSFSGAIMDDKTSKKIYDIVVAAKVAKSLLKPEQLSEHLEVQIIADEVLSHLELLKPILDRRQENQGYKITGEQLTIFSPDAEELKIFKEIKIPCQLVMIVKPSSQFSQEISIEFPPDLRYCYSRIAENIVNAATKKTQTSLNLKDIDTSRLHEWIDAEVLTASKALSFCQSILTQEQEYFVLVKNSTIEVSGKWNETSFLQIGEQLQEWFVAQFAHGKQEILLSSVKAKIKELLSDKNADIQPVITAIISQGIVELKRLRALDSKASDIIQNFETEIQLKNDSDAISKLYLKGYAILENNEKEIRSWLQENQGKSLHVDDLGKVLSEESEEILRYTFYILKSILRAYDLDSSLCHRLQLSDVPPHFCAPLDEVLLSLKPLFSDCAFDIKLASVQKLRTSLVAQRAIDTAQVIIPFSSKAQEKLESFLDTVKNNIKKEVTDVVMTNTVQKNVNETVNTFMEDICSVLEQSVGEIFRTQTPKVDVKTLTDILSADVAPPELKEYIRRCHDVVFSIVKAKERFWWWDWNAFAVSMIGIVQVAAGSAILFCTAGVAGTFASALISEGIGDIIYATQAGLTGTFSWKEWGTQKAISMSMSVLTAGVGSILSSGAEVATVGAKIGSRAMAEAIGKKVLGELLTAATDEITSHGVDWLAEITVKALLAIFKSKFKSFVESFAPEKVNEVKKSMKRIILVKGVTNAEMIINRALNKAMKSSELLKLIESGLSSVSEKLESQMKLVSSRLKYSPSASKAKGREKWAKYFKLCVKFLKVAIGFGEIFQCAQHSFDNLNGYLAQTVRDIESASTIEISDEQINAAIKKNIDTCSSKILDEIGSITEKKILSTFFTWAVSKIMKPVTDCIGKLDNDYDNIQNHLLRLGRLQHLVSDSTRAIDHSHEVETLTSEIFQTENTKFDSPLVPLTNETVLIDGQLLSVGEAKDRFGTEHLFGIKLPDGNFYLLRASADTYIDSLSVGKRLNHLDLQLLAETAGMKVVLVNRETNETSDLSNFDDKPVLYLDHKEFFMVKRKRNLAQNFGKVKRIVPSGLPWDPMQHFIYAEEKQKGKTHKQAAAVARNTSLNEHLVRVKEVAKASDNINRLFGQIQIVSS